MENERSIRRSLEHIAGEFKEIALVSVFAAAGVIINIVALQSLGMVVVTYLICLFATALVFGVIDYRSDEVEDDEDEGELDEAN